MSILLLQPLFPDVHPSLGHFLWDKCSFGPLGLCGRVRASHVCHGFSGMLLGFALSDGACGNNTGRRTLLLLPKSGEKTKQVLLYRTEKVIKVLECVILHMIGFPETPTVSDAQTSYSLSAINGNCMCIISCRQKQGHLS